MMEQIDADIERAFIVDILSGGDPITQSLPILAFCTLERGSIKVALYEGPHERSAIVEFVYKQVEPAARMLYTTGEVESFVQNPRFRDNGILPSTGVSVRKWQFWSIGWTNRYLCIMMLFSWTNKKIDCLDCLDCLDCVWLCLIRASFCRFLNLVDFDMCPHSLLRH